MTTVTAAELLILDAAQFEKEYQSWYAYALDYNWWDYTYDLFKETCETKGVDVEDITFSGFWSQGDGAAFAGRVSIPAFMQQHGLDVRYPALYIAVCNDCSYVRVRFSRNNNMECADYGMYGNQTDPEGVFGGLDRDAWVELVDEQERDADLEREIMDFCSGLANDLYETLETEHDYLTSQEQFIESCENNDITFEIEEEES